MKIGMPALRLLPICLGLVFGFLPAANAAKTHLTKVARVEAPPAGKVLVNIHGTFRDLIRYPIFDDTGRFLMDMPQHSEYQLICEPGTKSFVAWISMGGNVVIATAELAPDKIYDLALERHGFAAKFVVLAKDPKYRKKLVALEKGEKDKVFTLDRDEAAIAFEASQKQHIEDIKRDFLGGKKSERVVHVSKDDCR